MCFLFHVIRDDIMQLVKAVRQGNPGLYENLTDRQMFAHLKPYQLKSYVRRSTRCVEVYYLITFYHILFRIRYCCKNFFFISN